MYTSIVHFTRLTLQNRLKAAIAEHPYYGTTGTEPVTISTRKGYDFKRIPAILIHSPSGNEQVLDMNQFIQELESHVGLVQDAFFLTEVYENPTLPTYPSIDDDTYTITITEQRKLTVHQETTDQTTEYEFVEDTARDDIIPGTILRFASLNNISVGQEAVIVTYRIAQVVGDVIGGRWGLSIAIDVDAGRVEQEEDLTDLVTSILLSERSNFLKDGIELRPPFGIGNEADIPNNLSEEIFGHSLSVDFNLEWRLFQSQGIFKGWRLLVPVQPPDSAFPTYELTGESS